MSWQATTWAAELQKVTQTATQQLVLIMLANYAGEDGRNAFPSIARIARNTRLTVRAVQKTLRRLEEMGLIRQGNQRIAEAHIDRADKRPVVYDLNLSLTEISPESDASGANVVHPAVERGEPEDANGVNLTTERGEPRSPDPSLNNQENPSTRAPARDGALPDGAPSAPDDAGEGGEVALNGEAAPAAPKRAMTESERRRAHCQNFILDWLYGRRPLPMLVRELGLEDRTLDEAAIERIALSMAGTYLKAVDGLVRWAEACLAGDPAQRAPIASVESLMRALADPSRRALMARRLALLREAAMQARANDQGADEEEDAAA